VLSLSNHNLYDLLLQIFACVTQYAYLYVTDLYAIDFFFMKYILASRIFGEKQRACSARASLLKHGDYNNAFGEQTNGNTEAERACHCGGTNQVVRITHAYFFPYGIFVLSL